MGLVEWLRGALGGLSVVNTGSKPEYGKNVILMYHIVGEEYPSGRKFSHEVFERHLEFLTDQYEIVDLPDLVDETTDDHQCVLTFDGGYENFYTDVYPHLQEYEVPATQFIIPERIGHRQTTQESRLWIEWFDFMDRSQIEELIQDDLITIGNKSLTHVSILPALWDEETLQEEVVEGQNWLEDLFGISIDCFCYGSGRYDRMSANIVRSHHDYAVTTHNQHVQKESDPVMLPRISADFVDIDGLQRRLSVAFARKQKLNERKSRLIGSWPPHCDQEVRDCYRKRNQED